MAADPAVASDTPHNPPGSIEYVRPVSGIDLHVTETGSGEPLLILHGVTADATSPHREIEALGRRAGVRRGSGGRRHGYGGGGGGGGRGGRPVRLRGVVGAAVGQR